MTENTVNTPQEEKQYWGMNEKTFMLLMHLGQFAGFIVLYAGFALPIIMWITNKDQNEKINEQGKAILNWLISATIYAIVGTILIFAIVGIVILIALGILMIVFPIIGATKANNNEVWKYPLTINFIK